MHVFFLAMLLHPDIQERARQETDATLGTCRLPTFEDLGLVPYIDAVIKEVLRWQPIVRLGKSETTPFAYRHSRRTDVCSVCMFMQVFHASCCRTTSTRDIIWRKTLWSSSTFGEFICVV